MSQHPITLDRDEQRLCIECRHHVITPADRFGEVNFCTRPMSVITGNPERVACIAMRHPCLNACGVDGRYFEPHPDKMPAAPAERSERNHSEPEK